MNINIDHNFELKDEKYHYKCKEILEYINKKSKFLKNYNKISTLVLVKNDSGIFFWMNILFCIKNGYTCFPINSSYKLNELKYYYKTIITLNKKRVSIKINKKHIINKNTKEFNFISSTSGSTGKPKLILLKLKNIISNVKKVRDFCEIEKNKNYLIAVPGYFYSAILHFFTALVSGSKFIHIEKKIFPLDLFNILKKLSINYFGGPPIHNKWIIESENNLNNIEKIFSSGDFLDEKTILKYKYKKKNYDFYYMYGITEASGRICINNLKKSNQLNSVGKALSLYKIFFKNDDIYIKSNNLFYGYFFENNFERINSNIYQTGDKGYKVKKDNIILRGRKDDVFKSSGIKIFTQQIRNSLLETNLFNDVYVYKGELKNYGYVPFCAYEARKQVSLDKIRLTLKSKIDNFHTPKKFKWYTRLPRLANNKIDRIKIKKND